MPTFDADPYPWPYNGDWRPENTAIIVIDMQNDFCAKGGWVDHLGADYTPDRAPIEPLQRLLPVLREAGAPRIMNRAQALRAVAPHPREHDAEAAGAKQLRHRAEGGVCSRPDTPDGRLLVE